MIRDVALAEKAYDRADRAEAEERYADFMDLVDACTDALAEIRDGYAATLDEDALLEYEETFNRAVARRHPRFAVEL